MLTPYLLPLRRWRRGIATLDVDVEDGVVVVVEIGIGGDCGGDMVVWVWGYAGVVGQ